MLDNTVHASSVVGTPHYLSPEICTGQPYSSASDVWSFGLIVYEVMARRPPYDPSLNAAAVMAGVMLHGEHPRLPLGDAEGGESVGGRLEALYERCCQYKAADRPGFAEILEELEDICRHFDAEAADGAGIAL